MRHFIHFVLVVCCTTGIVCSYAEEENMPETDRNGNPETLHHKADRTLVSWFCFDDKTPSHCSVLTIETADDYEAIAFGEGIPNKWSIASNGNKRTQSPAEQANNKDEVIIPGVFIQMAAVFQGNHVTLYRHGEVYATYNIENNIDLLSSPYLKVSIGPVKLTDCASQSFAGKIEDIRIYGQALSQDQIRALKPNTASEIKPLAWWNFEPGNELKDICDFFPKARHDFMSKVNEGKLILGSENSYFWTVESEAIRIARDFRERLMDDPSRPTYHLINSEGDNDRLYPTDPNVAIFWKGKYHISYMYHGKDFGWAHFSSIDLVHWRREKTNCPSGLSGGCFINEKGEVTFVTDRGLAFSSDDNLENWSDWFEINLKDKNGQSMSNLRIWDPTGWYDGDSYYILVGQRPLPGEKHGGTLIKSKNLKDWRLVGPFLKHNMPDVRIDEDYSCSELFKLGDKYVWLLISHQLGCRYYIGTFENEQFVPEYHGRMNWNTYRISNLFHAPEFFAPRTLQAPDGRRIMFAWLPGGGNTLWSGTFCIPRELSLPDDGVLRIKPIREMEQLRYNETTENGISVKADMNYRLNGIRGDTIELDVIIKPTEDAQKFGARVLCDENNNGLNIFYNANENTISIGDGKDPLPRTKSLPYTVAPFELKNKEDLRLRIFIDKPIVEVFINDRQAVYKRHLHDVEDVGICLFSEGCDVEANVTAWKMAASNQW